MHLIPRIGLFKLVVYQKPGHLAPVLARGHNIDRDPNLMQALAWPDC